MASTACFLNHHAISTLARTTPSQQRFAPSLKPNHLVICRAQKQQSAQEDDEANNNAAGAGAVSRRLAFTLLIGAAAIGSKVSPADAAYGEAGNYLILWA